MICVEYLFQMLAGFLYWLLTAYQIALFIRMITEFFISESDEGTLYRVTYFLTEPLLALCSRLLAVFGVKNDGPIDLSIYVSLILTTVIRFSLSTFI